MKNIYLIDKVENDIFYAYSPNRCGLIFFKESLKNDISNILRGNFPIGKSDKLLKTISNEGFIIDESFFNLNKHQERPIRTLYLSITYNCNLNCKYCLCHNSFAKKRHVVCMSKEIAEKAISKFIKLSKENEEREVVLYGGEPVLYPELLKWIYYKVCQYESEALLEKNIIPARFILCTNGTLITKDFAEFLKFSGIYPAISIDGPKSFHDKYRPYHALNKGSFANSVKGYRILERYNIQPGLTTAYGKHNAFMISEHIKYFADNFNPKTIALNTMLDFELDGENPYVPGKEELTSYLWEGFLTARKKGMYLVKNVMDNRIRPFVERIPKKWGCTASGGRLGILPEGKVVPCMALSHKFGCDCDEVEDIHSFCPKELLEAGPYQNKKCENCYAKATCGGGCPAVPILQNKHIGVLDSIYCFSSKYFLKKIILLLWDLCKDEAKNALLADNFFLPSDEDRKKIYGKINVSEKILDFQHAGNVTK